MPDANRDTAIDELRVGNASYTFWITFIFPDGDLWANLAFPFRTVCRNDDIVAAPK